jgi:hypothetical protein
MLACSGSSTEYRKSWSMCSCSQEPTATMICDGAYISVTSKPVAVHLKCIRISNKLLHFYTIPL